MLNVRPTKRAEYMVNELGLSRNWIDSADKIIQGRTRAEASAFLVSEMLRHDGLGRNNTAEIVFTAMRMGIEVGLAIAEDEAISPLPNIAEVQEAQERIEKELEDDPE